MRIRDLVIIKAHTKLLLSSLLLAGLITYSGGVSAVKNGEKCLKVGAKKVTKGVVYECSKNAKGIKVWKSVNKSAFTPTTVARGVPTTVARGVPTTVARGVPTTVARVANTTGNSGDRQGPVLVSASVTPSSGDVATSSLTFSVSVRITDATGVANSPVARVRGPAGFYATTLMTRVSGDAKDGFYSASLVIPQGRPSGSYYISVSTPRDTIGNSSGSDGDWDSGPITVTNGSFEGDRQGPVLVSASVTPSSGDVATSSLTFSVSVRITDATGVANSPVARVRGPAGFYATTLMTRVSGDAKDGFYSASLVIPQGRPSGSYYISVSTPRDTIGNSSGSDGDWDSGPITVTNGP